MTGIRKRFGEIVTDENFASNRDVEKALIYQKQTGLRLGDILLGWGKLSLLQRQQALSKQRGLPFVNLLKHAPDEALLKQERVKDYMKLGVLPWHRVDDHVILAVTDITPEVEAWAKEHYARFRFVITSPYDIKHTLNRHFGEMLTEEACYLLWRSNPVQSARTVFFRPRTTFFLLIAFLLVASFYMAGSLLLGCLVALNIFFLLTVFYKALFLLYGLPRVREREEMDSLELLSDKNLPTYAIIVPLYKEKRRTVRQLLDALRALDYPKSLLDVKLAVEADDDATYRAILAEKPEWFFDIIRVPVSYPRTKPKACNYALKFTHAEFVTIYDAEDRPDVLQLKKVVRVYREADAKVGCIQCKLNYYNYNENLLTRLFALEYAGWFHFLLIGLERLKIPIPLGGTSNHFRTGLLKELHAWDPFNVTEDADLGIRLAQRGYVTKVIASTTLEEAPVSLKGWLYQRSRWIKGYMQTYLVHVRDPDRLYEHVGFKGFLGFLFFIGAPTLVFLSKPLVAGVFLWLYWSAPDLPLWFMLLSWVSVCAGMVLHLLMAAAVIWRFRWWEMAPFGVLFPFYWILHSIASFKAFYDLIRRPHHWEKTEHGLSKRLSAKEFSGIGA